MALRSATHSALLVLLIIQLLFVRTERPRVLLIIQLLLKALTTPLVLRAPDHPAAVCTRPTIISYRVCMCVCMRVSTRLYLPTTTTEYVCVCVCMCVWLAVSTPCVSTPSVCIYCVCVYLLHLLKTLTNAPALIAPTQRPSRVNSGLIIIFWVRVSTPSTQNPDERARSDRARSDRAHATPGLVGAA